MVKPKIKKPKTIAREHSGKLKSHDDTSYGLLAFVLLLAIFPLLAFTAQAATPYDGPEAGSIGLSGQVKGDPPKVGAQINAPPDNQRFATSPVTFSGTCPAGTLVEMFKNDIFAGSTACTNAGSFTVDIDLLIGQNTIVARVYDAINQPGPDSNKLTVFYDALPAQASPINSLDFGGPQLLINTDAVFRGAFPGQEMSVPIDIIGGTPPYAINVQWGDANNKIVSRGDNTTFHVPHTYQKPGIYQISIQASDGNGRVAFITVASIINGQPDIVASGNITQADIMSRLIVLWPIYTSTAAILLSFWLGARREKAMLAKRGQLLAS